MQNGRWTSYHDENVVSRGFPVFLRRIGDPKSYTPGDGPYTDEKSKLAFDSSGPFGHAVRFNQGYVFAEVPACFEPLLGILLDNVILLTTLENNRDDGYAAVSKAPTT